MSTKHWTQKMIQQYNDEIIKRQLLKKAKEERERLKTELRFPRIYAFRPNASEVMSVLMRSYQWHPTILKMMRHFFSPIPTRVKLNQRYLFNFRNAHPSYYSDRERWIVMLNRLPQLERDEKIEWWLSFFETEITYVVLINSLLYFQSFLNNPKSDFYLELSLFEIEKLQQKTGDESLDHYLHFLKASLLYLNSDFSKSQDLILKKQSAEVLPFAPLLKLVKQSA